MPLYEYECEKCGHRFEVRTTSFDVPNPPCSKELDSGETCSSPTRKLISRTTFVLKGGGWYKDNYS